MRQPRLLSARSRRAAPGAGKATPEASVGKAGGEHGREAVGLDDGLLVEGLEDDTHAAVSKAPRHHEAAGEPGTGDPGAGRENAVAERAHGVTGTEKESVNTPEAMLGVSVRTEAVSTENWTTSYDGTGPTTPNIFALPL